MSLYDIPLRSLHGEPTSLAEHKGKALLIVNVASKCGLTPQYTGLEELHEQYARRGASRCSASRATSSASRSRARAEEIETFCSTNYGVTFPLFEKIDVNGDGPPPALRGADAGTPTPRARPATSSGTSRSSSCHPTARSSPGSGPWSSRLHPSSSAAVEEALPG